jgi:hypothetical protein
MMEFAQKQVKEKELKNAVFLFYKQRCGGW